MVVLVLLLVICGMGAALAVTIPAARRADANHEAPLGDPFDTGPQWAPVRAVECECGKQLHAGTREHHVVAALFTDDAHLAGGPVEGGTAMVADYCPEHCPGGCDKGCPVPLKAFP
jgi:hypothetical protein